MADSSVEFPRFNSGIDRGRHYSNSFVVYGPNEAENLNRYIQGLSFTILVVDSKIDADSLNLQLTVDQRIEVFGEPNMVEVRNIVSGLPDTPCTVIGIGGGATMDFAKAIVCLRCYPGDDRIGYDVSGDLNSRIEKSADFLALIPTTVGSGSEASRYFVMFQDGKKMANRAWQALPNLIVMDPNLLTYLTNDSARIQLFDCWSHLTEVSLAHLELSYFNLFAVSSSKRALMGIVTTDGDLKTIRNLLQMQSLSYIGGSAISNTRTGAMHTVGEALASQLKIPHVWSLYFSAIHWHELFVGDLRNQGGSVVSDQSILIQDAIEDLKFWIPFLEKQSFNHLKIDAHQIREFNFDKFEKAVLSDAVLWNKEHPTILKDEQISKYLTLTVAELQKFSGSQPR